MQSVTAGGGFLVADKVEAAMAKSAVHKLPEVAHAAREAHFTIVGEMTAWEKDSNPEHLLRVIALQQELLQSHTESLLATAAEAKAAHGAMEVMAAELDRGQGGTGEPVESSRRMVAGSSAAVDHMAERIAQAAEQSHKRGAANIRVNANVLDIQHSLQQYHQLLEEIQKIEALRNGMAAHLIANLR